MKPVGSGVKAARIGDDVKSLRGLHSEMRYLGVRGAEGGMRL